MNRFNLIVIMGGIIMLLSLALFASYKYGQKQEELKLEAVNNLNVSKKQWKSKEGRLVTQVDNMQSNLKSLRRAKRISDQNASEYEKQLKKVRQYADELEIKIRDIESYSRTKVSEESEHEVKFKYDTVYKKLEIDSVKTKHLLITFDQVNDSTLDIGHEYWNEIQTIINRYKENNSGEHITFLPAWRFWKDWKYESRTVSADTNAIIDNHIQIEF